MYLYNEWVILWTPQREWNQLFRKEWAFPHNIIYSDMFYVAVAPLCYVYNDPVQLYFTFRELYTRYFFRLHNLSSHPQVSYNTSVCLSVHPATHSISHPQVSNNASVCLSVCLSVWLHTLSSHPQLIIIHPSVCLCVSPATHSVITPIG